MVSNWLWDYRLYNFYIWYQIGYAIIVCTTFTCGIKLIMILSFVQLLHMVSNWLWYYRLYNFYIWYQIDYDIIVCTTFTCGIKLIMILSYHMYQIDYVCTAFTYGIKLIMILSFVQLLHMVSNWLWYYRLYNFYIWYQIDWYYRAYNFYIWYQIDYDIIV